MIIGVFGGQEQKHFSPLVMWLQAKNSAGPKVVCLSESRKKN